MQELYSCHEREGKATRIQNILSGPGGTGKNILKLIQRDIYHLLHTTVNSDPDQTLVLMMTLTGTAALQIGGLTIDSALLTFDSSINKPMWETKTIM